MTRRRIRARPAFVFTCIGLAVLASILTAVIVRSGVAGLPDEIVDEVTRSLVAVFFVNIVVALLVGALAGRFLFAPLAKFRDDLTHPDRAERTSADSFRIEEYHQLGLAIDARVADLRSRLADAVKERDELLRMIESGNEGLLHISRTGKILHLNHAAGKMLGLPPNASGQQIRALLRKQELRLVLEQAAAGKIAEPHDVVVDDRHLVVTTRPIEGGALVSIMDLTEIRRLETVRRDFVANASHELKTPLTTIRGYAETLLDDDLPEDMRRQFVETIYRNTVRIQRIIDDLLDLSRLQSGGWIPELQEVNAAQVAEDVWATCKEAADRKHIAFAVNGNGSPCVSADPVGLRQILSNLFDNAIRYTPEGGRISVHIRHVDTSRSPDALKQVEISVHDNGSGIPRESLSRIFERFYRVDPARSRNEGGTGLGLSIVKHLVERMNGGVFAESELGKGTTIRVRLPAA